MLLVEDHIMKRSHIVKVGQMMANTTTISNKETVIKYITKQEYQCTSARSICLHKHKRVDTRTNKKIKINEKIVPDNN